MFGAELIESASAQCSFQYISNDTSYQDYIEFIYPRKSADEIIAIGSRINRGILNDSVFNAPIFSVFDYCGDILNKTFYKYIGNCKLMHTPIQTYNGYDSEPVANTSVKIEDDEFLLSDKAVDTLAHENVLILFKINEHGILKNYKTLSLNANQWFRFSIKNVLKLKDGKILVILSNTNEYYFYYFDEHLDFIYKKIFSLERGILSIKEVDNGEFICSSLTNDKSSFQFYRLDTNGANKWIKTPYNYNGAPVRAINIVNNKIYITGATLFFGIFLICDMDGTILKELKFDKYYCYPFFCSTYIDSDNSFVIGGYVDHCQSTDSSGTDVAVLKIDTSGTILWDKLYNFKSALGTSGPQGKYSDYGGFEIDKANDGGIITNGLSIYSRLSPGGVLYQNALLIKTEPILVTTTNNQVNANNPIFELSANPVTSNLNINGPVELIKNWVVYSLQGKDMLHGKDWREPINLQNLNSGLYSIKIMDQNNYHFFMKFIKI